MKKLEKMNVLNMPAIAYFSGCGGVEIKRIEYGIDDAVVFVAGAWCSDKSAHRARIYYNNNGAYFRFNGYTIPLSECIRV